MNNKGKRANWHDAYRWIAHNDNAGSGDSKEQIRGYVSVALVADLWNVTTEHVANCVAQQRISEGIPVHSGNDQTHE